MNEDIVNAAITSCIDRLRNEKGLSLSQIADKVGINYEPMRNLARGHVKRPYFDVILRLHELAGRGMDEHFGLVSGNRSDDERLRRRISNLESRLDDLELEKKLLLDWIRKHAADSGTDSDMTAIRFVHGPATSPESDEHKDEDVCCCDS
ncbi:helix-turn-helix transcriptional regulator [bacterium]|nr:helix-turn-helix transcriptional regulator [bacterium]